MQFNNDFRFPCAFIFPFFPEETHKKAGKVAKRWLQGHKGGKWDRQIGGEVSRGEGSGEREKGESQMSGEDRDRQRRRAECH